MKDRNISKNVYIYIFTHTQTMSLLRKIDIKIT